MRDVMRQPNANHVRRIELELSNTEDNKFFNLLKPTVFEEDKLYCCILGSDLRYGIRGFGHSPLEAIEDWEISLKKRISNPFANDKLAGYVSNILKNGNQYAAAG